MADQSDVEDALAQLISASLYPDGLRAASVLGTDCRIYRGWPTSAALDADLAAGRVNITVFPGGGGSRTTTRYAEQWQGPPPDVTLEAVLSGTSVTFTGTAATGQVAGILVDGSSYAYRVQPGDSPELVCANLAALARGNAIVRLTGSTLSIPGAAHVAGRVVADANVQCEVRRQQQEFRVSCWCPTPTVRDLAATTIDQSLSTRRFLPFADDTVGRMTYAGTAMFDQSQNARLYRRDLTYSVEYPTVVSATQPSMLFGDLVLNGAARYA